MILTEDIFLYFLCIVKQNIFILSPVEWHIVLVGTRTQVLLVLPSVSLDMRIRRGFSPPGEGCIVVVYESVILLQMFH